MVWDNIEFSYAAINAGEQSNLESEMAVVPLARAGLLADGAQSGAAACPLTDGVDLALLELPVSPGESLPPAITRHTGHDMLNSIGAVLASADSNRLELVSNARQNTAPKFAEAYHSMRQLVAMMDIARTQRQPAFLRTTLIGTASTYNPYRDGKLEGQAETASGELYDPGAWTAAIQINLRNQFGGVRYGRLYQPAYALVESDDKQVIVKVNDVGHLKPGRVLDLNERTMRHFDPFLTRGLLSDVKITLLPGENWTPGPVGAAKLIDFAASAWGTGPVQFGRNLPPNWQTGTGLPRLRMPFPSPTMEEGARAEAKSSVGG
jgi:peptidoglycan lytic transglycosylase